jgi:RimJ/RimL family protein N-acetyltransferase
VQKIFADVLSFNISPQKMHKAFGFSVEATHVGTTTRNGAPCDMLVFGLPAAQWIESRHAILARLPLRVQQAAECIYFH